MEVLYPMRYCRFETKSGPRYGEVQQREGQDWIERLLPPPEEDPWTQVPREAEDASFEAVPFYSAKLLAPVRPSKIVCVGRNYRDHAAELGNEVPKEPLLFLKAPSAIIGPGEAIRLPSESQRVDFEGELAIVIAKRASHIGADENWKHYIRGYTIVNDVTARDLQKSDGQWSRAKGFDTFCPVGPIVTDEVDPETGLSVETRLNGTVRQRGTTLDFLFSIPALLRYITAAMTLLPGDLVPTGTPAGVAPMQPGDLIEVTVAGVGTLTSFVTG